MLEHHLPFDSVREGLGQSGLAIEHVDLRVTPVRDRGLLLLQAASVHALQDALDETIDLTLPKVQNTSVRGDYALLWLAPAEWLLELQVNETGAVESELSRRLSSSLAVVTDISDALVSFELSGAGVPEILMTGCSLDLRSPAFPPAESRARRSRMFPRSCGIPANRTASAASSTADSPVIFCSGSRARHDKRILTSPRLPWRTRQAA